jgi:hypothetical protein
MPSSTASFEQIDTGIISGKKYQLSFDFSIDTGKIQIFQGTKLIYDSGVSASPSLSSSISPSTSPSVSPSVSMSPSISVSPSKSKSPSASPSASPSPSVPAM